jgi:hypothetical protein
MDVTDLQNGDESHVELSAKLRSAASDITFRSLADLLLPQISAGFQDSAPWRSGGSSW